MQSFDSLFLMQGTNVRIGVIERKDFGSRTRLQAVDGTTYC